LLRVSFATPLADLIEIACDDESQQLWDRKDHPVKLIPSRPQLDQVNQDCK
jgi:hypothetical protein